MIIELSDPSEWVTHASQDFNEDGDLLGDDKKVLLHGRDIIIDKSLDEEEQQETEVCQWHVKYKLKRVVKFQISTPNWDAIEETNG